MVVTVERPLAAFLDVAAHRWMCMGLSGGVKRAEREYKTPWFGNGGGGLFQFRQTPFNFVAQALASILASSCSRRSKMSSGCGGPNSRSKRTFVAWTLPFNACLTTAR